MGGPDLEEEIKPQEVKADLLRSHLPCDQMVHKGAETATRAHAGGALSTGDHVRAHKTSVVGDFSRENAADNEEFGGLLCC